MKLKEFIENNIGKRVKIGFGESFVFCDVVDNNTEHVLQGFSNLYKEQMSARIEKIKKSIDNLTDNKYMEVKEESLNLRIKKLKSDIESFKDPDVVRNYNERRARSKARVNVMPTVNEKIKILKRNLSAAEKELTKVPDKKIRRGELIEEKTETIKKIEKNIENFVPYLDTNSCEIYHSDISDCEIFISNDNPFIVGKYWDFDDYKNRFKVRKYDKSLRKKIKDVEKYYDNTETLVKFLASDYCNLISKNINPRFFLEEILNSELYLTT